MKQTVDTENMLNINMLFLSPLLCGCPSLVKTTTTNKLGLKNTYSKRHCGVKADSETFLGVTHFAIVKSLA